MKLQLKYYRAAILDWQCSERMLNSQQISLAESGLTISKVFWPCWVASLRGICSPLFPLWTCWEQWQVRPDFWKVNLQLTSSEYYFQLYKKCFMLEICACFLEGMFSSSDWFCCEWTATPRPQTNNVLQVLTCYSCVNRAILSPKSQLIKHRMKINWF